MAALKWRGPNAYNTYSAFLKTSGFAFAEIHIARLNKQWVIHGPEDLQPWAETEQRLVYFKGHRRYPTPEAAMAACQLIYADRV